jgi:hypothetical protein
MMAAKLPQVLAINLIKDARSYVECAQLLDEHRHQLGKVFDPNQHQLGPPHAVPIYFLLGQAIELALKAHLAASGVPKKKLRSRKIGHNIEWVRGLRAGAPSPARKREPHRGAVCCAAR